MPGRGIIRSGKNKNLELMRAQLELVRIFNATPSFNKF